MRAKIELQTEARRLRSEGVSVKEIARTLGVAKSSVSLWVRDVKLTEDQKITLDNRRRQFGETNKGAQANKERVQQLRQDYQAAGHEHAKSGRILHLAGCMLYWAEGSKDRNRMEFVNSDVHMMQFFMRFLREELELHDTAIKINIHCHTEDVDEQQRILNFWLRTLSLPESSAGNIYVKDGTESRRNRLINGVCGIRVESTEVAQHIYGAIQEYGGFDNPDWLL